MGFFQRLKEGLMKTSNSITNVFSKQTEIDDDFYDELEETLISADMGFDTTEKVIEDLREKVEELGIKDASECKELVMNSLRDQMNVPDNAYCFEDAKTVMLISIRIRAVPFFWRQLIHLEQVLLISFVPGLRELV